MLITYVFTLFTHLRPLCPCWLQGWALYEALLVALLRFLEPYLRNSDLNDSIRALYKGTLRLLLVRGALSWQRVFWGNYRMVLLPQPPLLLACIASSLPLLSSSVPPQLFLLP